MLRTGTVRGPGAVSRCAPPPLLAQVADCSFDSFAAPTIITPEGDFPGGFWLPRLAMSTINAALGLILSVSSFGKTPKSSNAPSKSTNGTLRHGFASAADSHASATAPCKMFRTARSM